MICLCHDPLIDTRFMCLVCGCQYKAPRTSGIRINFIGWYGEKNIGDDSFQSVFYPAFHRHELIFSQKPDPSADAYILGGGGVVDYGYFDGLLGTEKPIYGVGIDIPLNGPKYEDLILKTPFRKILIRSKEYFWLAREQGLKSVSYMPDLAFWFDPPSRKLPERTRIGVSLTQNLLKDSEHAPGHISRVLDRKKDLADIVFLIFRPDDERMVERVLSINPIPCKIIKPNTPDEMISSISELSALITMRFHGAVFANICKVPFLSLSTPGKHSLFCEQEDLHDSFIDFRDVNEYKLLAALNRMLTFKSRGEPEKNHQAVRKELAQIRFEIERLAG